MKETLKFTTKAKMATLQEMQTHGDKIEDEWDKGTVCISYKLGKNIYSVEGSALEAKALSLFHPALTQLH